VTAPESLLAHLESYWIAESLDDARQHLNDATSKGKKIVTRQGDLLSEYFLAGGVQSESSAIEIASELESLGDEIGELESQISAATQRKLKLEQDVTESNRKTQEALDSLRNHDEALAKSAEEAGAIRARISLLEERVVDLEKSAEEMEERRVSLESTKASLEEELAAEPEIEEEADTGVLEALEAQLEQAREQEVHLRVELGALNERKIAIEKELASTNQRISRTEFENKQRQAALERALKRTQAAEVITSIGTKVLAAVAAAGAKLLDEIAAMDAERVADQERQSRLLEEKAQAEAQKVELSEKIQSLEMKIYEENLQLSSLDEKSRSELGVPLEELVTRKSQEHQDLDDDALQSQIASQESLLSRIGTFNPLAVEEYAALEERYNYLTEQLEDMTKARAELREIIRDIDSTIDSTFRQAFEDTKKQFEEIFPVLFPGGTGSLSLTEPEGDEEPGIEVSIRPAGKRIERMSLLSGGERSLAAMALLVAIFKARPSPFYVLDEVEAALDDVNLERLLKVLKSLGETSQLIIVTHQKKTMEIADALYGVSMGADGVTKVMSQTLEKAS
ncbi:MAG: AAA family ATPase, partial [Aquiluna sp.]